MKAFFKIVLPITIVLFSLNIRAQQYENKKNTYVIVMDIQPYFTENMLNVAEAEKLINATNSLISKTNPENIIYVKTYHRMLVLSWKGIKVDTISNMEFDESLDIVNENIFIKTKMNAFTLDELNLFLQKRAAEKIVIAGLMAEDCIYQTLLGGKNNGFEMYVIPETIAAKSQKKKEKTLKKMIKKGVRVLYL